MKKYFPGTIQSVMRSIILFQLLVLSTALCAQNTKGVSVAYSSPQEQTGKTYALIVGISKYKNPAIPSLQFADRDALAFRNYLVASGVDSNNITLLMNENASYAETMLSLDELCTQKAKAGDKVFIYFSGHGDVESRVITNVGYLLPYDAPKVVYAISAINVRTLQDYVSTLSANGVQAIVITDACHSGNLAGGLEGMKNIQTVLGDKWKDEIKILSCQPGELSLEGKQWGNGRGLFSYELINGMAGKADRNNDETVSLRELNLYLMEKVPDEANPMPQNPVLIGNSEASISRANKQFLDSLAAQPNGNSFAAIDTRGFDDSFLNGVNDSIKEHYRNFNLYMDSAIYVRKPQLPSAYYFLNRVPQNNSTKLMIAVMKRNLSMGIINSSNQLLDNFVTSDMNSSLFDFEQKSAETKILRQLFGDDKLQKLGFLSKALFFESIPKDSVETKFAMSKIDSAIFLSPNAAYIQLWKASLLSYQYSLPDIKFREALPYAEKAIELSPQFAYGYIALSFTYRNSFEFESAILAARQLYQFGEDWELEAYKGLGSTYLFQYAFRDSTDKSLVDSIDYYFTRIIYDPKDRPLRSLFPFRNYNQMGDFFLEQRMLDKAILSFEKAAAANSTNGYCEIGLAKCYSMKLDQKKALHHLELSLQKGFKRIETIKSSYLDSIRSTPEFKALMRKYFPDQYKE